MALVLTPALMAQLSIGLPGFQPQPAQQNYPVPADAGTPSPDYSGPAPQQPTGPIMDQYGNPLPPDAPPTLMRTPGNFQAFQPPRRDFRIPTGPALFPVDTGVDPANPPTAVPPGYTATPGPGMITSDLRPIQPAPDSPYTPNAPPANQPYTPQANQPYTPYTHDAPPAVQPYTPDAPPGCVACGPQSNTPVTPGVPVNPPYGAPWPSPMPSDPNGNPQGAQSPFYPGDNAGQSCQSPTGPAPLRVTYLGGTFTPVAGQSTTTAKFQTQFASFKGLKFCIPAGPGLGYSVVEISANQFNYLPGQYGVPVDVFSILANESDGRIDLPWITNQNFIQVTIAALVPFGNQSPISCAFQGIAAG